MQKSTSDQRVQNDVRGAIGDGQSFAVAALWATYAFVFWKVLPYVGTPEVMYALAISGGIVLLFNTASILAMLQHYSGDKDHIYGLDLHYLDAMRADGSEGGTHGRRRLISRLSSRSSVSSIDSLFLLVLVVASLFAPVYFGLAGGGKTALEFADKTWAGMGQNADHAGAVGEARLHARDGRTT